MTKTIFKSHISFDIGNDAFVIIFLLKPLAINTIAYDFEVSSTEIIANENILKAYPSVTIVEDVTIFGNILQQNEKLIVDKVRKIGYSAETYDFVRSLSTKTNLLVKRTKSIELLLKYL